MPYLIKCEINGIQQFIFNVQSKGAAKTLKARSFFVEAVSYLAEDIYKGSFINADMLYTGGGSVYLLVDDRNWNKNTFDALAGQITSALLPYNLGVTAAFVACANVAHFGQALKTINQQTAIKKLQLGNLAADFFTPYTAADNGLDDFRDFTEEYIKFNAHTIVSVPLLEKAEINRGGIRLLNKQLKLCNKQQTVLLPLPKNNGNNIKTFEEIAALAFERTGTAKLGVLKLDIDSLGRLFTGLVNRADNRRVSDALKDFFSTQLHALLQTAFKVCRRVMRNGQPVKNEDTGFFECTNNRDAYFKDNLYPIFAGGDDCFIVGAWDATIEFAMALQEKFKHFEQQVRNGVQQIGSPITISASVTIVDENYPVVRFAEIAEESLSAAKSFVHKDTNGPPGGTVKNSICFMGHTFSWKQFGEVVEVKDKFVEMVVKYDAPKAVLQRIIKAYDTIDNQYWHNCKPAKPFDPALLWRFKYSFRDVRHKPYFKAYYDMDFFSEIKGYYTKHLWDNFNEGRKLSQVLPVAARWAELLCRK